MNILIKLIAIYFFKDEPTVYNINFNNITKAYTLNPIPGCIETSF